MAGGTTTSAIHSAIGDLGAISNLNFTEIADTFNGTDGADIDFWYYNTPADATSGYSYGVGGSGVYINQDSVFVANGTSTNRLEYGGLSYLTAATGLTCCAAMAVTTGCKAVRAMTG